MELIVIACHYKTGTNKTPNGFRMFDPSTGEVKDVAYEALKHVVANKLADVTNVEIENDKLKGSNGTFDRYTKIVGGKLVGSSKMVILRELGSTGYEVCDHLGKKFGFTSKDTIECARKYGIANGKLVEKQDGTVYISPISGVYKHVPDEIVSKQLMTSGKAKPVEVAEKPVEPKPVEPVVEQPKPIATPVKPIVKQSAKSAADEEARAAKVAKASADYADRVRRAKVPIITGREVSPANSKMTQRSKTNPDATLEQKLLRQYLIIKDARLFYYSVLQTLKKKESTEIPTMAVSLDTMYYNADFVSERTDPELLFVVLHELCHVIMKHNTRRKQRDPEQWNIACDLYINKMLCVECGVNALTLEPVVFDKNKFGAKIQFPRRGLYEDTVDIEKDTPESIYKEIDAESKQIPDNNQQGDQGDNQDGKQGQSNPGNMGSQGQQQGQGQGQSSQGQTSQGSQGTGQSGQGQTGQDGDQPGQSPSTRKEYRFRGKKLGESGQMANNGMADIVEDAKSRGMSETAKKELYEGLMKKAKVLEKQMQAGKGKGNMGIAEAYVDAELVPKVNWRTVLMNRLMQVTSEEKSLSSPDRRHAHSGLYLGGVRKEEKLLKDVKITVDTSGSMTDLDIAVAFEQIKQLLNTYKVDAEVIFWDDGIQERCKFEDYDSLMLARNRATGRGGTDPNCVYELFESREYQRNNSKPEIIITFTDGLFAGPSEKYAGKYGRDTLWVISNNHTGMSGKFEPPFGKVAKLSID